MPLSSEVLPRTPAVEFQGEASGMWIEMPLHLVVAWLAGRIVTGRRAGTRVMLHRFTNMDPRIQA